MQTILGSSGIIGKELAQHLTKYTSKVRLVSRAPKTIEGNEELLSADLLNAAQTDAAVAGSEVVYLTAGLKYHVPTWQQQWPVIMRNVMDACKKYQSKLVFFDNVYAYGKVDGWMTEASPYNAVSKKGLVRKQIAEMLMREVEEGKLQALIARAADFYGPNTSNSFVNVLVMEKQANGKKGQWMANADVLHSFTYTPDAGIATAILGNSDFAFNQVWHLPTAKPALSGKAFAAMSADEFGVPAQLQVIPKLMLHLLGLFVAPIRESIELIYQNDSDYLFDSSKFEKTFDMHPTSYAEGIKTTAQSLKKS
jgi:nucleoside-diphosphate-sugar epimerase